MSWADFSRQEATQIAASQRLGYLWAAIYFVDVLRDALDEWRRRHRYLEDG